MVAPDTSPRTLLFYNVVDLDIIGSIRHMHTCTHARTHTHNYFTALLDFVRDYPCEPAPDQEGKTNLDLLEQEIVSGNGISWAICRSAP